MGVEGVKMNTWHCRGEAPLEQMCNAEGHIPGPRASLEPQGTERPKGRDGGQRSGQEYQHVQRLRNKFMVQLGKGRLFCPLDSRTEHEFVGIKEGVRQRGNKVYEGI